MRRIAMLTAVMCLTLSVVLYIFGTSAVCAVSIAVFVLAITVFALKDRIDNSLSISAVLLISAAFGVYLCAFHSVSVVKTQELAGRSGTVTAYVCEEPQYEDDFAIVSVKTSRDKSLNSGLCSDIRLDLLVDADHEISAASVGDVIKADVVFYDLKEENRRYGYADKVFVSAFCKSAEITGHKYTPYETAVKVRQAVRQKINNAFSGNARGMLNGIVLGDNSAMSDELYSAFKICGILHVTAVSGMHISVICSAIITVLSLFMKRRTAFIAALLPMFTVVAVTGFNASAVRSGIMCAITFLGSVFLKKTDGLNSLGFSIIIMLLINPFYVCDLGFGLSCTATAGVIAATKFYSDKISPSFDKLKKKWIKLPTETAVMVFVQSLGAVAFTLPLQIIEFGFVSIASPIACVAVSTAVVYTLTMGVLGIVLSFIPFLGFVSKGVFLIPLLLMKYIEIVIMLLSRLPFSYIPFGTDWAILWIGTSLALVGVWYLVGKIGGKRLLSLLIAVLLTVSVWSSTLVFHDTVEISSINLEKGYCTVIYSGKKCVIIGCGSEDADAYTVFNDLKLHGVTEVDAVLLPNGSEAVLKGANKLCSLLSLKMPSVSQQGTVEQTLDNVDIIAHSAENGCYYEILVYGKTVIVGFGSYKCDIKADALFSGRALPQTVGSEITVVSGAPLEKTDTSFGRVIYNTQGVVSLRYSKGKDVAIYGRQDNRVHN